MLDEEDLWNEEKEEPVQSEPGKKEDRKATRILISMIDEKFLNELEEAETAHDLYCEIWYRFQKKARKEGCKARRHLYSLTKDKLTIEQLITRIRELSPWREHKRVR